MVWMNEYDIEESLRSTAINETPNLRKGAEILSNLKEWTNRNSDGWPYWQKPANAATKLMAHLHAARVTYDGEDISENDLKDAMRPIKAFLTRQGVDHSEVFKEEQVASKLTFKYLLITENAQQETNDVESALETARVMLLANNDVTILIRREE